MRTRRFISEIYCYFIKIGIMAKKIFANMNLAQQMIIPIAVVGSIVLLGLASYESIEIFKITKTHAIDRTGEIGQRSAQEIKNFFDKPFAHVETVGRSIHWQIEKGVQNRDLSILSLKDALESHPDYLASWAGFEPNAFDGQDEKYKNAPHHEKSGRFYPWWIRQGTNITYKTIINEETPEFGDWYFIPQKLKKNILTEPYGDTVDGQYMLMTSAVYSVVQKSQFLGVVGIDLSLEQVSQIASKVLPFPDTKAYLLTDSKKIVSGPEKENLMKPFSADASVMNLIDKSEFSHGEFTGDNGDKNLYVTIPIQIYDLDQKWTLVLETPMKTILAPAYQNLLKVGLSSILAQFVLMLTVYFSAKKLSAKMAFITTNLNDSASTISHSLRALNTTSAKLSDSSSAAASSIQQTISSLEQVTAKVQQNTKNAQTAAEMSSESSKLAKIGEAEVRRLISVMTEIESSSHKIEDIIHIIDDIAFQTNLLALNASVEAARAGEHGKGFSVVAEAVRNLAQRSATAAQDVSLLINSNVENINQGTQVARVNGDILHKISSGIEKMAQLNSEIASASLEQSTSISMINSSINSIDSIIQDSASQAIEIVHTANEIDETSDVMNTTVRALKGEIAS